MLFLCATQCHRMLPIRKCYHAQPCAAYAQPMCPRSTEMPTLVLPKCCLTCPLHVLGLSALPKCHLCAAATLPNCNHKQSVPNALPNASTPCASELIPTATEVPPQCWVQPSAPEHHMECFHHTVGCSQSATPTMIPQRFQTQPCATTNNRCNADVLHCGSAAYECYHRATYALPRSCQCAADMPHCGSAMPPCVTKCSPSAP